MSPFEDLLQLVFIKKADVLLKFMSKFCKKKKINPYPFPPLLVCVFFFNSVINLARKTVIPFIALVISLIW